MPTYSYRALKKNRKRQLVQDHGNKLGRKLAKQIQNDEEINNLQVPQYWRPKIYGDCKSLPRPCPFVGCRYNLWLETSEVGSVKTLGTEIDKVSETCALDVADRGGVTLQEVGEMLGVSRERVRQMEHEALNKLARKYPEVANFLENSTPCG